MILENYNVLNEQGVIATKSNQFEGETIMYSFHCYPPKKGMFDLSNIKPNILLPIDVLYKSKQSDEELFIVVTGESTYHNGTLMINLNGNTNIILEKSYGVDVVTNVVGEDEVYGAFNDYGIYKDFLDFMEEFVAHSHPLSHNYFKISKEDFLRCCQALTISIQEKKDDHEVMQTWQDKEKWRVSDTLLPIFRTLYNKAIDSSMFTDAEKAASALYEEEASKKKKGFFGLFK